MRIRPVQTRCDLQRFIDLPYRLTGTQEHKAISASAREARCRLRPTCFSTNGAL